MYMSLYSLNLRCHKVATHQEFSVFNHVESYKPLDKGQQEIKNIAGKTHLNTNYISKVIDITHLRYNLW